MSSGILCNYVALLPENQCRKRLHLTEFCNQFWESVNTLLWNYSREFIYLMKQCRCVGLLARLVIALAIRGSLSKRLGPVRLDSAQLSSARYGALDVDHYVNYGQIDNANERRVLQSTRWRCQRDTYCR